MGEAFQFDWSEEELVVDSIYYRAARKTHISSLPRRREPSQIKQLDTRLRGYDGFFEVPYRLLQYSELYANCFLILRFYIP